MRHHLRLLRQHHDLHVDELHHNDNDGNELKYFGDVDDGNVDDDHQHDQHVNVGDHFHVNFNNLDNFGDDGHDEDNGDYCIDHILFDVHVHGNLDVHFVDLDIGDDDVDDVGDVDDYVDYGFQYDDHLEGALQLDRSSRIACSSGLSSGFER
eukprot:TRINITY_DN21418_c0_g1_i1.p3 TRINITY_DN21418_c0_g1~~TRINITY_DN21418_c0_g1_i1.p3  ORF type:complete len:152 (-),score=53.59 TRINITY_DN21418_c0_g1_i1:693-1148(-)